MATEVIMWSDSRGVLFPTQEGADASTEVNTIQDALNTLSGVDDINWAAANVDTRIVAAALCAQFTFTLIPPPPPPPAPPAPAPAP